VFHGSRSAFPFLVEGAADLPARTDPDPQVLWAGTAGKGRCHGLDFWAQLLDPNVWNGGVLQEENFETAALGLVWEVLCQGHNARFMYFFLFLLSGHPWQ
jgi:hypothetical protein